MSTVSTFLWPCSGHYGRQVMNDIHIATFSLYKQHGQGYNLIPFLPTHES